MGNGELEGLAQIQARSRVWVELVAATAFAALTAMGARMQFALPFTPVPVTAQVFCVLLAGGLLGPRAGLISQIEYLIAGVSGLPVFAYGGGPQYLLGPTAGYLVAFPAAAWVTGALTQRLGRGCGPLAGGLAGVGVIHALGALWFAIWVAAAGAGAQAGVVAQRAVAPFIAVDLAKAAAAAAVVALVRRRASTAGGPRQQ